jgi:hypothetical protein
VTTRQSHAQVNELTLSLNSARGPMLLRSWGAAVSKIERRDEESPRERKDHELLGTQLKQAFPFPASGRFEDLLLALDKVERARPT